MMPELIWNKIYWYVWRMKQREICEEYKEKCELETDNGRLRYMDYYDNYDNGQTRGMTYVNKRSILSVLGPYASDGYIQNFKIGDWTGMNGRMVKIPSKYWYSSGVNNKNGFVEII